MPRSLTVCAQPGCTELVERGHCATHRPKRKAHARGQVYSTAAWMRRAARYRKRHPQCTCGCGRPTVDVDHIVPRQILVAAGIHDPDADRWLQPLAHACHSAKTAAVDRPLLDALAAGGTPGVLAQRAIDANRAWLGRVAYPRG